MLLALAARVGDTRLIDNVTLTVRDAEVHADLGVELASDASTAELVESEEDAKCTAR